LTAGLLDRRLVQRPGLVDDVTCDVLDAHRERETLLDLVVAVDHPVHGRVHVLPIDLGEKSDVAHVDAEHRGAGIAHEFGCAQDRAVTAEDDGQFQIVRGDVLAEQADPGESGVCGDEFVPVGGGQHRHGSCFAQRVDDTQGGGDGVGPLGMGDDQDAALVHRPPATRVICLVHSDGSLPRPGATCTRYSAFPYVPRIGEARMPSIPSPTSCAAQSVRSTASMRRVGLVTSPPRTAVRRTSNCGLTSSTTSPPGATTPATAGSTSSREMKERSPTTRSGSSLSPVTSVRFAAVMWRTLNPSTDVTPGSAATASASWPWPTSTASTR